MPAAPSIQLPESLSRRVSRGRCRGLASPDKPRDAPRTRFAHLPHQSGDLFDRDHENEHPTTSPPGFPIDPRLNHFFTPLHRRPGSVIPGLIPPADYTLPDLTPNRLNTPIPFAALIRERTQDRRANLNRPGDFGNRPAPPAGRIFTAGNASTFRSGFENRHRKKVLSSLNKSANAHFQPAAAPNHQYPATPKRPNRSTAQLTSLYQRFQKRTNFAGCPHQ